MGFWAELLEVLSFYRIAKPNGGRHYLETQGQVSWNHFSCKRVFFLNNRNRALLHPEMSISWWCARKSTNQTGVQMWVLTWLGISHLTCPGFLIRKMETIVGSQRRTVVKRIMSVSVLETKEATCNYQYYLQYLLIIQHLYLIILWGYFRVKAGQYGWLGFLKAK